MDITDIWIWVLKTWSLNTKYVRVSGMPTLIKQHDCKTLQTRRKMNL